MSLSSSETVYCRSCGKEFEATVYQSINDRIPNAAKKIMTGELFQIICPHCGHEDHLEYNILFNDFEHRAWIQVVYENELIEPYSRVLDINGKYMTDMRMRIVRNINELRQKVTAFVMNRDDRVVELCKFWCAISLPQHFPDFELLCDPIYTANLETGEEAIFLYGKKGEKQYVPLTDELLQSMCQLFEDYSKEKDRKRFIYNFAWAKEFTLNLAARQVISHDELEQTTD